MNSNKVVGPEYKDEYKRKHRSKFLTQDPETKKRFGVFKVPETFKPEHKEHFQSLYPYNPDIIEAYKLPEDKKEVAKIQKTKKISIPQTETSNQLKETEKLDNQQDDFDIEENKEEEKNKFENVIKSKFIKIFDPKLQAEEIKELEVELYIKKGSKTDKIMKSITNVEKAVEFFAMYGNTTPTKFIFLEKVKHPEEWIFSPYELKVIDREKIGNDYFIVTLTGITHVYSVTSSDHRDKIPEQATENYTPSEWTYQSTLFNILRRINYFKQYLPFKLFSMWRNFNRFKKFQSVRKTLSDKLFLAKPAFVEKMIQSNSQINKILKVSLQRIVGDAAWTSCTMKDFEDCQRREFEAAKTEFKKIIETEVLDTLRELYRNISNRLKDVREIDETENSKTLPELKNKSMYNLKIEARLRAKLIKLATLDERAFDKFVTMTDLMCVEMLYRLNRQNLQEMKKELLARKNNQAYFTLRLAFGDAIVTLTPNKETIFQKFQEVFKGMIDTIIEAPRLISIFAKKNYEQILLIDAANANEKNLDPDHVNVKTNDALDDEIKKTFKYIIEKSKYYSKYTQFIFDKLENDFKFVFDDSNRSFEEFKPLQLEKQKYTGTEDVAATSPSIVDVRKKIEESNIWKTKVNLNIKGTFNPNIMLVDSKQVKDEFNKYLDSVKQNYEDYLKNSYLQLKKEITDAVRQGDTKCSVEKNTTEKTCKFIEDLNAFQPTMQKLEENVTKITSIYTLIKQFNIENLSAKELNDYEQSLKNAYIDLDKKIKENRSEINANKDNMKNGISADIEKIKANIIELNQNITTSVAYLDDKTDRGTIRKLLTENKADINDYKLKMDKNNGFLRTLEYQPSEDIEDEWKKLDEVYELKYNLWNTVIRLEENMDKWKGFTINEMKNAKLDDEIRDFNIAITNLNHQIAEPEKDKVLSLLNKLSNEMNKFAPVIQVLSSTSMQERHWKEFFKIINIEYADGILNSITFGEIMNKDEISVESDRIDNISAAAIAQEKIMKDIEKISNDWADIKFGIQNQSKTKNEVKYIISSVEDIFNALDEHSQLVASALSSRHVADIRAEVDEWDDMLNSISNIIEEWLLVQKQWIYLENIFSAEDIKKQLPEASKNFSKVNKGFKDLMHKTYADPVVINRCKQEGLLDMLVRFHKELDIIQKSLEDYLQTKRKAFPRFYFLSNDELLKILSNTRQPRLVNDYLSKCFDGIKCVNFISESSNEIIEMVSPENEVVQLTHSLFATENIEGWLNDLERSMFESVYDKTKLCLEKYPAFAELETRLPNDPKVVEKQSGTIDNTYWESRREWIFAGYPCQSIITNDQIIWGIWVENQIDGIQHGRTLSDFYAYMQGLIYELSKQVKEKTDPLRKSLVERLIIINVHAREVVNDMRNKGVHNKNDFEWQKNLKFYWENDTNVQTGEDRMEVVIKQTNSRFIYGYEYLGNPERMVITPLTDRCYITLTSALNINFGGAPAGPAGTGKTETTKDLSKALAIKVNVFNCTDQLDYKMMGRMFCGLAECGAWACFDEFNRIEIEVLSVIAQQIETIQMHLREKKWVMDFDGKTIKLKPRFGVFITMNPGYAGRTELPDNLKSLFRPVAMMIPDYSLVAEVILYSKGFEDAKPLSIKMYQLFKLSSEQLSKQKHYDFGLRGIKSILTRAGYLKEKFSKDDEDVVLIRAMKDSNLPKFLKDDIVLFNAIIDDLFPGKKVEKTENKIFFDKVKEITERENLRCTQGFIEKVGQLLDTMMVRLGNMIVGKTGTAKTTIYQILMKTLTELGKVKELAESDDWYCPIKSELLNPKAVPKSDLYMAKDEITQTWEDGIVAKIMRDAEEAEKLPGGTSKRLWLIFDGPVDATWIEDMNTVLDDSRKLCLPDSSNIRIPKMMNLIFEVQDLEVASPATVSRCGMVYMEPHHVGIIPVIRSWVLNYQDKLRKVLEEELAKASSKERCEKYIKQIENIGNDLEKMIPKFLSFIRERCKEKIPSVDINLTQSCLNFISCFYQPDIIKPEVPNITDVCNYYIAFSIIWSIGANIADESREIFNREIKVRFSPLNVTFGNMDIYDVCINPGSTTFEKFFDRITDKEPFKYDDSFPFFNILIPTNDTVKYKEIMNTLAINGYNSLFMGETGVGKSVIIMDYLKNEKSGRFIYKSSNFSAKTNSKNIFDILKTTIYKNGNFAPPAGKKFIYFIDDINLPQLDLFGAQQPIEFIRQLIDNKMLYDEKKTKRTIKDTIFISACAPPSGGRNPVTPRLFRHFNMIWMTDLSLESMQSIFKTIVSSWLSNTKNLEKETDTLIDSALKMYNKIRDKLLPTPSKSHYTFNLRDMSKVIQGMVKANLNDLVDKKILVLLWIHETSRQFRDRLLFEDIAWFDKEIKTLYEGPLQMEKNTLMSLDQLIFTDVKEKSYRLNVDFNNLHKKINDELESYNTATRAGQMKLVFFTDAINHFCRIARILSLARGNALLIGLGGSGRQSLTKLVVFALKQEMNTLQIGKGYGVEAFLKDIAKILLKSGMSDKRQAFLFSDTQILYESFLEDINNILNNGEVPNLLKDDEIAVVFNNLKDAAKQNGYPETKDGVYQFFVSNVRDNLHIVLSFSPVGSSFRNRCIQFPSIINCCTIDWFNVWPDDALKSVAERYIKTIGETVRGQPTNTVKPLEAHVIEQLGNIFVQIQKKALELSGRFQNELRRYYYITPTSYLEFIKLFLDIYNEKIKIIPTQIANYKLGIGKLKEANEIVYQLNESLKKLEPEQIESKKNVEEMIGVLEEKKTIVDSERQKIQGEKDVVDVERGKILKIKEECDAEMAKAKPALDNAKEALSKLDEGDLKQLRSYAKPSENILALARNLCFVFDRKSTDYSEFKILLTDTKRFKENCQNEAMMVAKLNDPRKLKELGTLFEQIREKDFTKVSEAAVGLKAYVGALLEYVKTYREVKPKMDQQEKATKQLMAVEAELEEKSKTLREKEAELNKLKKEYDDAVRRMDELARSIKMINTKMIRAGKLVNGLKDEGVRWQEKIVQLSKEEKNLMANVIISSTVVSYFGPFTIEFRKEFLTTVKEYIIKAGIHYSTAELEEPYEEVEVDDDEEEKKKEGEGEGDADGEGDGEGEKKESEGNSNNEGDDNKDKEEEKKDDNNNANANTNNNANANNTNEKKPGKKKIRKWRALTEEEIEERLIPENIPQFDIQEMLSDAMEIRDWTYSGLPADELSLENAIITVRAKRWPLIIDPQMQANKWIRNYYRSRNINTYKITNKNLFNNLKNCISNGFPCLIENVEQTIDSSLEPILANQVFKQGAGYYLSMGGSEKPIQYINTFKLFMTSKMANPHYLPEISIKVTLINFTVTRKGLEDQLLVEVVKHEKPELEAQKDNTMLSINNSKKLISDLETSILNLVKDAGNDILDNDILVNKLDESKVQSAAIKETLATAEVTARTINKERTSYHPIAVRGSILYFAIASLANIDSMYNYSLEYFLKLFNQRLNKSQTSKDINTRVDILINDITISFYEKISRGLFEKDKLLYSFLIVTSKLLNDLTIDEKEWQFFLRGAGSYNPKIDDKHVYYTKGVDKWMDMETYLKITSFKEGCDHFYNIDDVIANFTSDDVAQFKKFMTSDMPHLEMFPKELEEKVPGFRKLVLVKQLREEKLIFAIKHFIETSFDKRFLESPPFSVPTAYDDSLKTTPLIFILSPGANPVKFLRDFARNMNITMRNISLGQGQGDIAKRAIMDSIKTGEWVCLENCHLARSWMPKFEEILEEVNDKEAEINDNYRLWLTSMPSDTFPASILQSGVKITNEPPKGIRASLKGTYLNIKEDDFKDSSLPTELKKLTFGLAFFHAIILERRKFGPLGWNIPYEWMNSDLEASRLHLKMYVEAYASEGVPFEILRFLIGTINYGGRVTDDKDDKLISSILAKYFNLLLFDENYKFSESGIYYAPCVDSMESINAYIEQLPLDDEPEVFGLNNNANITLQNKMVREFMEPLIGIQPRTSAAGGRKPDDIVLEMKYDIDVKFGDVKNLETKNANPKSIDADGGEVKDDDKEQQQQQQQTSKKKDKKSKDDNEKKKSPLGNFLLQECDKFNNLLKVMRASLRSLELAVKGTEVMSPQIEKVYHSFLDGQVPKLWADNAYLSLKPLGSWIKDLIERVNFMSAWLYEGPQNSFWISSFFFPQGFNTAVLQTYARKIKHPIDQLTFRTNVSQRKPTDEGIEYPEDGVNIHGLFLEGASWNVTGVQLKEQSFGELSFEMPVIWLEPIKVENLVKQGYYECPLYKTSRRAGELSTTGHSTNFVMYFYLKYDETDSTKNQEHWIRRGTALLTQLDN